MTCRAHPRIGVPMRSYTSAFQYVCLLIDAPLRLRLAAF
jgi:hypothetical protein